MPSACRRCLLIMIIAAIMTIIKIMIMKISCALSSLAAFCLICVLPADGIEEFEFSGERQIECNMKIERWRES